MLRVLEGAVRRFTGALGVKLREAGAGESARSKHGKVRYQCPTKDLKVILTEARQLCRTFQSACITYPALDP